MPGEVGSFEPYSLPWRHFVSLVDVELQSRGKEVNLYSKFMKSSGLDDELLVNYLEDEDPVANYW